MTDEPEASKPRKVSEGPKANRRNLRAIAVGGSDGLDATNVDSPRERDQGRQMNTYFEALG